MTFLNIYLILRAFIKFIQIFAFSVPFKSLVNIKKIVSILRQ
jgi:hypothetical protein